MYNDRCGTHDCFDCGNCLALSDNYLCLAHKIMVVPTTDLACYKWVSDDHVNMDADIAAHQREQENAQTLH